MKLEPTVKSWSQLHPNSCRCTPTKGNPIPLGHRPHLTVAINDRHFLFLFFLDRQHGCRLGAGRQMGNGDSCSLSLTRSLSCCVWVVCVGSTAGAAEARPRSHADMLSHTADGPRGAVGVGVGEQWAGNGAAVSGAFQRVTDSRVGTGGFGGGHPLPLLLPPLPEMSPSRQHLHLFN